MRKALIEKLIKMQKWRRGTGISMPYTPTQFGVMIDDCIHILQKLTDKQFNELLDGRQGIVR